MSGSRPNGECLESEHTRSFFNGTNDTTACVPPARRVHITSVTLEHLNGAYKVEDGDGQERDPYLKLHGVITYLVINPKVELNAKY